jgi:hippurate hydrolase
MDSELRGRATEWRRHLHRHPELSLQERQTAAFVCDRLREMGISFEAGVGGNGVVATLTRGQSNRSVGLRADMDALPILETSGLAYASTNDGVMHACGHDGHTASLLGAAALLSRDSDWTGTIRLVFQPAEEGYGGARSMIEDGLFDRFPMERIFGYHNWPGLEAGAVMVHHGPVMAAGGRIVIEINGQAGHAAIPHLTRDPVLAAGHVLVGLQSIVARTLNPVDSGVVSICMVHGGVASNQIPDRVTLSGTLRYFTDATGNLLEESIRRVVAGVASMLDVQASVEIKRGVSATINSPAEAEIAARGVLDIGAVARRDLPPTMASEDFGWYLAERPGAFAWIGNGAGGELHTPGYDFNDEILPVASGWLAATARRALAE